MTANQTYELIDFGNGRKLERFGDRIVDRPSPPAAKFAKSLSAKLWNSADLRFVSNGPTDDSNHDSSQSGRLANRVNSNAMKAASGKGGSGKWVSKSDNDQNEWLLDLGFAQMQLACSPVGHLGVFPDQINNWRWVTEQGESFRDWDLLNLFAYTGSTTLAAARAGFRVTHVDSAKNIVQRARGNAELSGLQDAPVRWITDDVRKYVAREIKRGRKYQAIILDPPSYGHGVKSEAWKIEEDLPELIRSLANLVDESKFMFLLTCHSPEHDEEKLAELCRPILQRFTSTEFVAGPMNLSDRNGRDLNNGYFLRFRTTL